MAQRWGGITGGRGWQGVLLVAAACAVGASTCRARPDASAARPQPLANEKKAKVSASERSTILARARVWRPPAQPIGTVDFLQPPPGEGMLLPTSEIDCTFSVRASSGLTPKFDCVRPDGDVLKVKYGRSNPETRTEVVSTRLLSALGFGADRMYPVARIRCRSCPRYPYARLWWLDSVMAALDESVTFELPVVERRHPGVPVESDGVEGWAFHELAYIDPAVGGATRAETDALRLAAVFLANWDTKYENQRLVCLDARPRNGKPCAEPLALMQDVGATFGPHSLDLVSWRSRGIWSDAASCTVSMKSLPFQGATFVDARISDAGRRLLADALRQLSTQQVRTLFTAARIGEYEAHLVPEAADVASWARAFEERVRQIADRAPCPE